jgi:hypothetical protein
MINIFMYNDTQILILYNILFIDRIKKYRAVHSYTYVKKLEIHITKL